MTKVTVWYPLRATAHNLSLIVRTLLVGPGHFGRAAVRLVVTDDSAPLTNAFSKLRPCQIIARSHHMTFHSNLAAKLPHQPITPPIIAFSTGC